MKKTNKAIKKATKILPEEAVAYIESFNNMINDIDEPTVPISVRVPANILRTLKTTAKIKGVKYQSLLVSYLRNGLQKKE